MMWGASYLEDGVCECNDGAEWTWKYEEAKASLGTSLTVKPQTRILNSVSITNALDVKNPTIISVINGIPTPKSKSVMGYCKNPVCTKKEWYSKDLNRCYTTCPKGFVKDLEAEAKGVFTCKEMKDVGCPE
jgi:hypothetical protein